jgi:hypothetical protein
MRIVSPTVTTLSTITLAILCLLFLVSISDFNHGSIDSLFYLLALFGAGIWWATRLAIYAWSRTQYRRNGLEQAPPRLPSLFAWSLEPLLLVTTFALGSANIPGKVRFAIGEPYLLRYAQKISAGTEEFPHAPVRVGVYNVKRVERLHDGTVRMVTCSGILDTMGVVYRPLPGPPPQQGENYYTHLKGPWYAWQESW